MFAKVSEYIARWSRRRGTGNLLEVTDFRKVSRIDFQHAVRRRVNYAYLGDNIGLCRILGRYKVYIDTTDVGLSPHFAFEGYWEMWVTEFMLQAVRLGMVAVDIGANIGYFTLLMADLVGPEGRVHAFEPNPAIAQLLRRSVHVNGFLPRVDIYGEALGDRNGGRFRMAIPDNYPGGACLVEAQEGYVGRLTEVRRLDSYEAILDADIIKIDAEGGEYSIWRGMTGVLERGRPLTILLEFVLNRYADPGAFLDEALSHGFRLSYIHFVDGLKYIDRAEILGWPADWETMLVLIR